MNSKLQPQKEILVDGDKYIVQLYSPTIGLTLYAKLLRLLGEPLVKLMTMFEGKDLNALKASDLDFGTAGEALQALFAQLKDEEFVPLIKEILQSTFNAGSLTAVTDTFDSQFMGRYNHVFKLVAKTLGVQYPDFLSGIGKRLSAVKGASASAPKVET